MIKIKRLLQNYLSTPTASIGDTAIQADGTLCPLRIPAGMTKLRLLQEALKISIKLTALIIFFCSFLFQWTDVAVAEELEIVNRPVNTSGLTGLLMTTSPYTLAPGTVEIGPLSCPKTASA
jgi:hypothetical protein